MTPVNNILDLPLEKATFSVVDVETTGLKPQSGGIIEIGIVKVSGLQIIDRYQSFVNPGRLIPPFITQLTGISDKDLYDAPYFDEIADEIIDFVGESILTAHNFPFDNSFLQKEFAAVGKEKPGLLNLCTLKIARRVFASLRSKSLSSVANFLRIKNPDAHRALADALVTANILIKMIKKLKKEQCLSTVGDLINYQFMPKEGRLNIKIKKQLAADIVSLPDAPGNYYFLNSKKQIIYIGKAKSIRNRVKSYFSPTAPRKAKKIITQAAHLKINITNSELTALLNEAESIKSSKPRHNRQLKKYGNKYFLRITKAHKFPAIEICNRFDFDGNDYFGLFISRKKAEIIFEMIKKSFAIRECDDKEFDKKRSCFLAQIDRCLSPCTGNNLELYNEELENVYQFLYGKNQFVLNRLLNKMKDYSARQKFEQAAEIKELIDLILKQTHKSSLIAEPVNKANILFEIIGPFNRDYLLMLEGKVYVKNFNGNKKDMFDDALDDYFSDTHFVNKLPGEEDLEKMKITLNWIIKNRNNVNIFYLKEFNSKEDLFEKLSLYGRPNNLSDIFFDIRNLTYLEN